MDLLTCTSLETLHDNFHNNFCKFKKKKKRKNERENDDNDNNNENEKNLETLQDQMTLSMIIRRIMELI